MMRFTLTFARIRRWNRKTFVPFLGICFRETLEWLLDNPVATFYRWCKRPNLHAIRNKRPKFPARGDYGSFLRAWTKIFWRSLPGFRKEYIWRSYGANFTADEYTSSDVRFRGKTLTERKILVIEREIDLQGMGKYQYWIWVLCASGYFLDLLWAQAIGLIILPVRNEYSFSTDQVTTLFAIWSTGLTIGAVVFGFLVDLIGRYWAFNLTVLITSVFGIAMGAANSYHTLVTLAFFNGLGIGGNIPIDTTICLEFLPERRRDLLPLLSFFQPLGVIALTGMAWGFIPSQSCLTKYNNIPSCVDTALNYPDCLPPCSNVQPGEACCEMADNRGWRNVLYTAGGISLGIFVARFFLFNFQESPKYLIVRKRDAEAVNVIQWIAAYNGKPTTFSIDQFHELDRLDKLSDTQQVIPPVPTSRLGALRGKVGDILGNYSKVFAKGRKKLSIVVLFIYAFDYWGFSIAGAVLPTILEERNSELGLSLQDTYRDFMAIFAPGLGGVILGYVMYHIPGHGRRWGMIISAAGYCAALFAFSSMKTHSAYVGISVMEYFFQSMFNSILYSWTPEAFPSDIRGTASGLASGTGRAVSAFMPVVAGKVLSKYGGSSPLYLAGAGVGVLFFLVTLLPKRVFKPENNRGL